MTAAEINRLIMSDALRRRSLCNEKLCDRGIPDYNGTARIAKRIFEQWDPAMGRPVSANPHDFLYWNRNGTMLDMIGIDYGLGGYDTTHQLAPTFPIIGSEMGSATSDRGTFATAPNVSFIKGSTVPEDGHAMGKSAGAWLGVLTRPFVAGGFEWSGFDYKGEPVPNKWPDVNSHFGESTEML